jgi:hypothetical protein
MKFGCFGVSMLSYTDLPGFVGALQIIASSLRMQAECRETTYQPLRAMMLSRLLGACGLGRLIYRFPHAYFQTGGISSQRL